MNSLTKKIKAAVLMVGIAFCVMFGSVQKSNAAFYNNYYSLYTYYSNLYRTTGVAQYHWHAVAFYYYYLAGYNGDSYGYYYDGFGFKSTNYRGSTTYAGYYYNTYAYYGDYYARL
jgi:hypothetical protein